MKNPLRWCQSRWHWALAYESDETNRLRAYLAHRAILFGTKFAYAEGVKFVSPGLSQPGLRRLRLPWGNYRRGLYAESVIQETRLTRWYSCTTLSA